MDTFVKNSARSIGGQQERPAGGMGASAAHNDDFFERRKSGSSSLLLDSALRARGRSGTDGFQEDDGREGSIICWETHRQEILREFGEAGSGGSGADQVISIKNHGRDFVRNIDYMLCIA